MLLTISGTKWPILCQCAVNKLLTHLGLLYWLVLNYPIISRIGYLLGSLAGIILAHTVTVTIAIMM